MFELLGIVSMIFVWYLEVNGNWFEFLVIGICWWNRLVNNLCLLNFRVI